MFRDVRVLIKGAGDLGTGVAVRLWRAGFRIVMTELERPVAIRRTVAFSEAVYDGETTVEGVTARRVGGPQELQKSWDGNVIPVLVDPTGRTVPAVEPDVLVDAVLAKTNLGTTITDAPLVIGLGPGFVAGQDVHAVVETNRGHYLGRVLWDGGAEPDTGVPGTVNGVREQRVIYAPVEGLFRQRRPIGSVLEKDEIVGWVAETPVTTRIAGVLRGLIHDGVPVNPHMKIGDVDPRGIADHCRTISDKALALGGGVLEAILVYLNRRDR